MNVEAYMSKYDAMLNMDEDNSLSYILRNIDPDSEVLEFGPATGRMTRYMKEQLNCKVTIVELDEECYKKAMQYADHGVLGNIETLDWARELKGQHFDFITFADVLEHLHNPEEIIVKCQDFLKEDGRLCISVPNIAHNSIITNLLKDTFQYNNIGLLDNTHIHFFTCESIINMVEDNGYFIEKKLPVYIGAMANEFPYDYSDLNDMERTVLFDHTFGKVYQLVLIAVKKTYAKMKHLKACDLDVNLYEESTLRIYVNTGSGDRIEESEVAPVRFGQNSVNFELSKYNSVRSFRCDFVRGTPCVLRLDSIKCDDITYRTDNLHGNYSVCCGNLYFFDTHNAFLYIMPKENLVHKLHLDFYIEKNYNGYILSSLVNSLGLEIEQLRQKCYNSAEIRSVLESNMNELKQIIDKKQECLQAENTNLFKKNVVLNTEINRAIEKKNGETDALRAEIQSLRKHTEDLITVNLSIHNNLTDIVLDKQNKKESAGIKNRIKTIYHRIPVSGNMKNRLKHIVFDNLKMFHHKNVYTSWKMFCGEQKLREKYPINIGEQQENLQKNEYRQAFISDSIEMIASLNKKIAVQLHLFYIDLLDEFVQYLQNMPYKFDLYVSVVDSTFVEAVKRKVCKIENIGTYEIEVVPNRGRDIAPWLVTFRKQLLQYDYIGHIHSKKSLYTGNERLNWRQYLLENLLGNYMHIGRIFTLLEKYPEVGICYQEPYYDMPYWAYNWLANKGLGEKLLIDCGLDPDAVDDYFDIPCGTMFWAKREAIFPLLAHEFCIEDFPEESGQTDGTLAHAVERCVGIVPDLLGFKTMTTDIEKGLFFIGKTNKNMSAYFNRGQQQLMEIVQRYNIITFDIFDTLIMRAYLKPDYVFDAVQICVEKNMNLNIPFKTWRIQSEVFWRHKHSAVEDCTIDEIYEEFKKLSHLSDAEILQIKEWEINTELNCCIPRPDMIDFINYCIASHKRVILISDMYLTSDIIIQMLRKCGVAQVDELWVSCETNRRKDAGTVWKYVKENFDCDQVIHIGDNARSDIQMTSDIGLANFHVFNSLDMLQISHYFSGIDKLVGNYIDAYFTGICAAKLFSSPFALNNKLGQKYIEDYYTLGYVGYGAIICNYIIWLAEHVKQYNAKTVLFIAREGHVFKPLFEMMQKHDHELNSVKTVYLLGSRRALSVASIFEPEDAYQMLKTGYYGTVKKLFYNRFGLSVEDEFSEHVIALPGDFNVGCSLVDYYWDKIKGIAEIERRLYLKYINELNIDLGNPVVIADIGYAGSAQYYLSKLLEKSLHGVYMGINDQRLPEHIKGNSMVGLYCKGENLAETSSIMYKYHIGLEAVLTAPQGQFLHFKCDEKDKIMPVYDTLFRNEEQLQHLQEIHNGIIDYMKALLTYCNYNLLETSTSCVVENIYSRMFECREYISQSLKDTLVIDDKYSSGGFIKVYDLY